uniref:Cilia- and flagella-associated protein 263 n=1 Tax=Mola mola TaxID=94237 RepID=A0A3Q4BUF8_MOLML
MFERYISRDGEQSPSSRSSVSDPPRQLTLEQKLFVAQREVTETRQDLEKLKERYDTIQDNYKASMKEAEFRLAELRRGRNVFKHRLQKHMKDNRVEKKEPEKVLQYVEDRSTVKITLSEHIVTLELNELSSDINNKNQMLVRIEEETQHAEEERLKAEALNKHLRRQMTDYQAPDIIEYMHIKNKRKKLQKSIRTWERRVIIAQNALRDFCQSWHKATF